MDCIINFILEMAEAARGCACYHYAADLYMVALERTGRREYLRSANECRAWALGVLA